MVDFIVLHNCAVNGGLKSCFSLRPHMLHAFEAV